MNASDRARELLRVAAAAAEDKQGDDLVAIDVSSRLPITDVFFLVSGASERQVVAIAEEIEERLLDASVKPLRREGRAEGRWILLDFGELVVHVFHREERSYYSLERLWADCPVLAAELGEHADAGADAVSSPA